MPKLSIDEVYGFLAEPNHLARIATVDHDGMPRVVPLWFIMDGDLLCFTPREPAVIWTNMLRDARIGISIDEDEIPYRKVTIQGHVQVLYQPGRDRLWQHLYRAIASRYISVEAANAYVDGTDDQPRALCAVDLTAATTRLSSWRMPAEGEDPRGIWHPRYYLPGTKMDPRA
jgi:nitroimidazol reductase NimA-like FMN-containing flavoprotein (pyridoxamine 5'-phosphate oxidase superfamily)